MTYTVVQSNHQICNGILGKEDKFSIRTIGRKKVVSEDHVYLVTVPFMRRGFELRLTNSLGRNSQALNIYPVMELGQDVWMMCRSGDISGLQPAFDNGTLSPFVSDHFGETLLHARTSGSFFILLTDGP